MGSVTGLKKHTKRNPVHSFMPHCTQMPLSTTNSLLKPAVVKEGAINKLNSGKSKTNTTVREVLKSP